MDIQPFHDSYLLEAAELFLRQYRKLREAVPVLPERMENQALLEDMLGKFLTGHPAVAAVENGRLAGYLGWYEVGNFRGSGRCAAYCPEWGHAAEGSSRRIDNAMYRAAAAQWYDQGCRTHALTILAGDPVTQDTWFWSGFGLGVVDAIRDLTPLGAHAPAGVTLRKAEASEVELLAALEAEHWQHYSRSPIFMGAICPSPAEEIAEVLENPDNSFWVAFQGSQAMSYLRFERQSFGASAIVRDERTVAITGAYTRPEDRGRGLVPALLDAALGDYRSRGFARCSVDFESFNPEAAVFWTRYFQPVCYSLFRVPEKA